MYMYTKQNNVYIFMILYVIKYITYDYHIQSYIELYTNMPLHVHVHAQMKPTLTSVRAAVSQIDTD